MSCLALFSRTRLPALPNTPTMTELGVPIVLDNMKGLMGPANMPAPVVRYLQDHFHRAMQTASWKEYVAKSGLTEDYADGPPLAPPHHHPLDQPVPGPAGRVPPDWQWRLH